MTKKRRLNSQMPDAELLLTRLFRSLMRSRGKRTKTTAKLSRSIPYVHQWGWDNNIIGFGWSQKGRKRHPCVVFFVRRKFHEKRLKKQEIICREISLARSGFYARTDVIEVGERWHLHTPRRIELGVDVAHARAFGPGTLGLYVRPSGGSAPVFMMSCSHVLAKSGLASPGDFIEQPFVPISDPVSFRAAKLTNDFTRLDLASDHREDVAFGQMLAEVTASTTFQQGGTYQPPFDPRPAKDFPSPFAVVLFGASSKQPKPGSVIAADTTITVDDDVNLPSGKPLRFHGVVIASYEIPTQKGDSGGVVLAAQTRQPCGLHIAGSHDGSTGAFFPLGPILSKRGLELL